MCNPPPDENPGHAELLQPGYGKERHEARRTLHIGLALSTHILDPYQIPMYPVKDDLRDPKLLLT